MRKSSYFLIFLLLNGIFLAMIGSHAVWRQQADRANLHAQKDLVARLGITDLCLFTEARYTRHPSQADFHSPFQDSPLSLEHFPSGSLVVPPYKVGNRRKLN
jgi:hypothetical protein